MEEDHIEIISGIWKIICSFLYAFLLGNIFSQHGTLQTMFPYIFDVYYVLLFTIMSTIFSYGIYASVRDIVIKLIKIKNGEE